MLLSQIFHDISKTFIVLTVIFSLPFFGLLGTNFFFGAMGFVVVNEKAIQTTPSIICELNFKQNFRICICSAGLLGP